MLETVGKCDFPWEPGKFFTLKLLIESDTKDVVVLLNDAAIGKQQVKPITKDPAQLCFGNGSGSIGGVVDIRRLRLGVVE